MTKLLLNRDLLKLTLFTLLKPFIYFGIMFLMDWLWMDTFHINETHPHITFIAGLLTTAFFVYAFIVSPVLFPERFSDYEDEGLLIFVPFTTSSMVVGGALFLLAIQAVFKYIKGIILLAIAIVFSVYTAIFMVIFLSYVSSIIKKGICKEKTYDKVRNIYYTLYSKDLDFGFVDKLMDRFKKIKYV